MNIISNEAALPGDIKRNNRRSILQTLRSGEPVSAGDICNAVGLSRPTVMKILRELIEEGVIRSTGLGNTTDRGGKKPELFVFADMRRVLCISIWPRTITFSHCSLIEDVHDFEQISFDTTADLEKVIDKSREILKVYLEKHGIAKKDIYGVAVNTPGIVDNDYREIYFNMKAPKWGSHIDITGILRDMFEPGTLFYVENAGKAAGRALLKDNAVYSDKRLLTIFSTWGISACMIEKGHVLNGRDALIGEIGHMIVSDSSLETCQCGKRGCLESLAREERMHMLLRERGLNVDDTFSFKDMFEMSAKGDPACRMVSRDLAHYFSVALHNLALSYNQDIVVFQGNFAWADTVFDQTIRDELREFAYFDEGDAMEICYDRRDLYQMAARGNAEQIKKHYFKI